jgi:hypothetical protein
MITLQLCQRHLNEIAEFAPDEKLQSEAQKCVRLLDRRRREALKPWATAELSKLESRPGSGFSRLLLLQDLHGVARRMKVFQAALGAIDEATASPVAGS